MVNKVKRFHGVFSKVNAAFFFSSLNYCNGTMVSDTVVILIYYIVVRNPLLIPRHRSQEFRTPNLIYYNAVSFTGRLMSRRHGLTPWSGRVWDWFFDSLSGPRVPSTPRSEPILSGGRLPPDPISGCTLGVTPPPSWWDWRSIPGIRQEPGACMSALTWVPDHHLTRRKTEPYH